MRIGAVSQLTGVSERLLRYYEQRGLLHPTRSSNGYREYGDADVSTVRSIRWLLDTGMPTAVIAQVATCVAAGVEPTVVQCPELVLQLRQQRVRLLQNIATLRGSLDLLDTALPSNTDELHQD